MNVAIGMLWFDNDPKADLEAKIARAVAYYQKSKLRTARTVYTNPFNMPANTPELTIGAVVVIPSRSVLPNHFLISADLRQK